MTCTGAVNRSVEVVRSAVRNLPGLDKTSPELLKKVRLFTDCTNAQLLDPSFAGELVKFAYLEVRCSLPSLLLHAFPGARQKSYCLQVK